MKQVTTAIAVLLASMLVTACAQKEAAAPVDAVPAAAAPAEPVAVAPAEPAAAAPANDEDASQTGGDKVAPKGPETPPQG
jgi:PBP1b-binding outer membrane lipoprotein LpoB